MTVKAPGKSPPGERQQKVENVTKPFPPLAAESLSQQMKAKGSKKNGEKGWVDENRASSLYGEKKPEGSIPITYR
jgi:hypothetical protein